MNAWQDLGSGKLTLSDRLWALAVRPSTKQMRALHDVTPDSCRSADGPEPVVYMIFGERPILAEAADRTSRSGLNNAPQIRSSSR